MYGQKIRDDDYLKHAYDLLYCWDRVSQDTRQAEKLTAKRLVKMIRAEDDYVKFSLNWQMSIVNFA